MSQAAELRSQAFEEKLVRIIEALDEEKKSSKRTCEELDKEKKASKRIQSYPVITNAKIWPFSFVIARISLQRDRIWCRDPSKIREIDSLQREIRYNGVRDSGVRLYSVIPAKGRAWVRIGGGLQIGREGVWVVAGERSLIRRFLQLRCGGLGREVGYLSVTLLVLVSHV